MRSVPWSTHFESIRMPPNSASDTATVTMPAMVISTLRRSETIVSRAKYAMRVHMCGVSSRRRRRRAPGRGRACPRSSSITRRRMASTMRWSCVAITTVVPVRLMRSRSRMMPTVVAGSRFPVGSSASRISGRFTNARAIETRCCSPPESSVGEAVGLLRQADEVEDLRHLGAHDVARAGRSPPWRRRRSRRRSCSAAA